MSAVAVLSEEQLRAMLEAAAEMGARRALAAPRDEGLLSAQQMAARLGVHPRVLVRWAAQGRVPGRRVGSRWRFVEAEVIAAQEAK